MILETEPDSLPEKQDFLNLFYSDFMKLLLEPLFQPLPAGTKDWKEVVTTM